MDIIAKQIEQVFRSKGYLFFDAGKKYNLNIFGVRNNTPINTFSDSLCVLYRNEWNKWQFYQWPATTRPGAKALRMPRNVRGTGILVPGQYRGVYAIDKHQGKYDALCQRLGNVKVVRDPDRDAEIDFNLDRMEEGMFGVNIHKALRDTPTVDEWSYLCQVFRRDSDFNRFMAICKKSSELWGNRFTYTLLDEHDFNLKF
jgi:hypothetical protein